MPCVYFRAKGPIFEREASNFKKRSLQDGFEDDKLDTASEHRLQHASRLSRGIPGEELFEGFIPQRARELMLMEPDWWI